VEPKCVFAVSPTQRQCSWHAPLLAAPIHSAPFCRGPWEEGEVAGGYLKMSVGLQNELFDFACMSGWRGHPCRLCPLLINCCQIMIC